MLLNHDIFNPVDKKPSLYKKNKNRPQYGAGIKRRKRLVFRYKMHRNLTNNTFANQYSKITRINLYRKSYQYNQVSYSSNFNKRYCFQG